MAHNLARVGGICLLFAVTFALGSLIGKNDNRTEEKFRNTIAGRLNPKLSHATFRTQQQAGADSSDSFHVYCSLRAGYYWLRRGSLGLRVEE